MFVIMISLVIPLFLLFQDIHGLNTYVTPAADDSFENFPITESIPCDGKQGVGPIQNALTIADFNRQYVTFNFKGKGNAQLLIHSDADTASEGAVTVVIGGGSNNNELTIYNSKPQEVFNETTLDTITSEHEFRSFWIRVDSDTQDMYVGLCHDPYQNQILSAQGIENFKLLYISLSTTSNNSGEWQFASDYEILGGCRTSTECNSNYCVDSTDSFLQGTCVDAVLQEVPDDGFGDGRCQTVTKDSTESLLTTLKKSSETPSRNTTFAIVAQSSGTSTYFTTLTVGLKEKSTSKTTYKTNIPINNATILTTSFKQSTPGVTIPSSNSDITTNTSFWTRIYLTSNALDFSRTAGENKDMNDNSSTQTVPKDDGIEDKTLHTITIAVSSVGGVAFLGLVSGLAYRYHNQNNNGCSSMSFVRRRNKVGHEMGNGEDSNATLKQAGMP